MQKVSKYAVGPIVGLALIYAGIIIPQTGHATTSERIVADPQTGLAISGFDPVSYFVDKSAKFGLPEYEHSYGGAVWRFRNQGNRAAFVAHPDIYSPRFGGYDPNAVAQGKAVAGHPLNWTINNQRLYLFYDAKSRAEFAAEPERIIKEAVRRWPQVEHALTP
jgi:hypothetical protein